MLAHYCLLVLLLIAQLTVWQVAVVELAQVHAAMNFPTAVSLLENRPSVFYYIVGIALVLTNAGTFAWAARFFRLRRRISGEHTDRDLPPD